MPLYGCWFTRLDNDAVFDYNRFYLNYIIWNTASTNKNFGLCFSFQFGEMSELGCQPGIKNPHLCFSFQRPNFAVWSVDVSFLPYCCSVSAVQCCSIGYLVLFSAVQFLQHVVSFDLVVLIRPLSGLECGFEVFLLYCSLLFFILCCSVSAICYFFWCGCFV